MTKWKVGYSDGSGKKYVTNEKDNAICVVRWGCSCCENLKPLTYDEEVNLRLIANAPRMLDMLIKGHKPGEVGLLVAEIVGDRHE